VNSPGFRYASEEFGTQEMKTDEVVLMVEVCRGNGQTTDETLNFIKFVDAVLWYKKRQMVLNMDNKTRAGYFRKDSTYYNVLKDFVKGLVAADMEAKGEDTSDFLI